MTKTLGNRILDLGVVKERSTLAPSCSTDTTLQGGIQDAHLIQMWLAFSSGPKTKAFARFLESFEEVNLPTDSKRQVAACLAFRGIYGIWKWHRVFFGILQAEELWLVFENEGFSLTHFLFKTQPGSQVRRIAWITSSSWNVWSAWKTPPTKCQVVERSTFWWLVKQGLPWGGQVIKNFAYQLLQGPLVWDLWVCPSIFLEIRFGKLDGLP